MAEQVRRHIGVKKSGRDCRKRSRLEAGFAEWCDHVGFKWKYEPAAYGSEGGQYLPDFVIDAVYCGWLGQERTLYVDVKPPTFWDLHPDDRDLFVRRMCLILKSDPAAVLAVVMPGQAYVVIEATDAPYLAPVEWTLNAPASWTGKGWASSVGVALLVGRGPWDDEYWTVR